jgi:DNA-binding IclR family transcriptional regulator
MTTAKITDKQRRALEVLEAARRQGCSLVEYAQREGLVVREIYDALAALRRKGVLPRASDAGRQQSGFVAVRVASSPLARAAAPGLHPSTGVLCRIVQRDYVIECLQWPPPGWLAGLTAGSADAAS